MVSTVSELFKSNHIAIVGLHANLPIAEGFSESKKDEARIPRGDPGFGVCFCQGRMA